MKENEKKQSTMSETGWNSLEKLYDQMKSDEISPELNDTVFKKALEVWGKEAQFGMVNEECAELIVAINQLKRNRVDITDMMEEVVDVTIMMKQMRFIDPALFDAIYKIKVRKIRRKLGMEG